MISKGLKTKLMDFFFKANLGSTKKVAREKKVCHQVNHEKEKN
jgi:hypothetical protein